MGKYTVLSLLHLLLHHDQLDQLQDQLLLHLVLGVNIRLVNIVILIHMIVRHIALLIVIVFGKTINIHDLHLPPRDQQAV
jgi:hypothetical protein